MILRRRPAWLLALPAALVLACPAPAATRFVRADGGDAQQCTGARDAAYPGQGSGQACAWSHPFVALPPHRSSRIAGGDTLLIRAGSYRMGIGAPAAEACRTGDPRECVMGAIPSGPSRQRPTRILGLGHDTGCKAPPELWATEGARAILRLSDSRHVEVACLELTDHSECIKSHNRGGNAAGETARCRVESTPRGMWGEFGIHAADSQDVLLRDLDIHGLAVNGIRAGRLRDWTLLRVRLRANGWAGWDGNLQDAAAGSSNGGSIRFSGGEIAWNGCGERYPGGEVFGCWAQQQGGYGDGLGTARSGGDWVFEDLHVHHNTSDGLDLLYLDGSGSATVRRARVEGNAGNQIKVSGPVTIENTVAVGNCAFFADFPTSNLTARDHCRANGNTLSLRPTDRALAVIRHNTIAGQGDCLMITTHGAATATVRVQNNAFIGDADWRKSRDRPQLTCGHYAMESRTPVVFERNLFWRVQDDFCPAGNLCARDPLLADAAFPRFDPTPQPTSPLVDAGQRLAAPGEDFHRNPRPTGVAPDIGAIELQSRGAARPAR